MSVLQITPAERTALQMLADGLAHQDIASNLSVSDCVLDAELRTLFARMGVAGRNQAIAEAVRRGLVVTQRRCQEPRDRRASWRVARCKSSGRRRIERTNPPNDLDQEDAAARSVADACETSQARAESEPRHATLPSQRD